MFLTTFNLVMVHNKYNFIITLIIKLYLYGTLTSKILPVDLKITMNKARF